MMLSNAVKALGLGSRGAACGAELRAAGGRAAPGPRPSPRARPDARRALPLLFSPNSRPELQVSAQKRIIVA